MKRVSYNFIFAILFILHANDVRALEKPTHSSLNGTAVDKSGLDGYLKDTKIFLNGVKEIINGKRIEIWIQDGGKTEDEPAYTRSRNHFHNPLLPSDQAGLNSGIFAGKSSILWIQDQSNRRITDLGGDWSWNIARKFYYAALSGDSTALNGFKVEESLFNSTTITGKINMNETERNQFFAWTFRAAGQLIHLIEDASVPAHTRNDTHIFYNYENWVENNPIAVTTAVSNSTFFNGTISTIASFIDTDQYNGTNPPSGNAIGLSEYTNANFFSEDTINASNFPYPDITKTTVTEKTAPSGTYQRQYYLKNCCGETKGGQGYLLSAVDYLDYYRLQYPSLSFALPKIPVLDDNVYSNYASLLLPRAVGYSASLINYFFRGQINMEKDPNNSSQYVIKNESDEYMSGNFTLYYDDASDNRKYLTSWNKAINSKSVSDSVSFTEPTDAKEKGKYILIFQGTLGNETGTVVGRVVIVKGNPEGRVLYLTSNNSIAVADSKGTLTFYLPNVINSDETVVAARFDRSDWNVFVIATSKGPSNPPPSPLPPSSITGALWNWRYPPLYSERSNYLHKFQINEYFRINYLGVIYSDTYANYEMSDSALTYTEPLPNGGSATYITEGFAIYYPDNTNSSVPFKPASGWNWVGKIKTKTIKDIYVDGNIVKPLIEIREAEASNSVSYAGKQLYNGRWVDFWTSAINCNRRIAIVYGESPLNERVDNIARSLKSGSSLSGLYSPVVETLSSGETSTGEVWNPLLIANQDNIFYTKKEPPDTNTFKLYRSPNTLLLPSHFYSSDIFSYIRKDDGYSLAFNRSYYGELYSSISTEGGTLSDVMFIGNKDLIGFNIKYTGNWTDWSRSPYRIFRTHSIYLLKANIDPALPNGYEIKDISPILASWWDTRRAFKKLDFILKGD